jgi:hypothetical protein
MCDINYDIGPQKNYRAVILINEGYKIRDYGL